jgi:hypothetical protein
VLAQFWGWLNKDAEFAHMPSLSSVSDEFTAAQHAYALLMRFVFLMSEAALIGLGLAAFPGFIWLFMGVLRFPTPLEFISAIVATGSMFLLLRKGHAVMRTAVFDAIRNRALRRLSRDVPRDVVTLDATAASGGSPFAVSVDVDHLEEHVRK